VIKKLLALSIALVGLAAFVASDMVPAAASINLNSSRSYIYKTTGKVTAVNEKAKTFTVIAKGNLVTFSATQLNTLPGVGKIIDITYTQKGNGPLTVTAVNISKSSTY
jgi:hypothetical protein